jgi:hypothetical protein
MEKKTFEDWKAEFEKILMDKYGITINDCTDEEQLKTEFKDGSSPQEFVDWIGEKYDLQTIKEMGGGW